MDEEINQTKPNKKLSSPS